MRAMMKKILLSLAAVLIIMQFFTIDKSTPSTSPSSDFLVVTTPTSEVASILKSACYDCHSYDTQYPWYSNVTPASWFLKKHINDGRHELNFSVWDDYTTKRKDHKLEEASELILDNEMPLLPYTWLHDKARLTDTERKLIADWFDKVRTDLTFSPDSTSIKLQY